MPAHAGHECCSPGSLQKVVPKKEACGWESLGSKRSADGI